MTRLVLASGSAVLYFFYQFLNLFIFMDFFYWTFFKIIFQEYILNSRGLKLFTCKWVPVNEEPKGLIFICHGYAMECSITMNSKYIFIFCSIYICVLSNKKGKELIIWILINLIMIIPGTAIRLVKAGFAVYGIDYEGHGKSSGLQGYIKSFDNVVDDCTNFFTEICGKYPIFPFQLLPFLFP